MRELISNLALIGMALALLIAFSFMRITGRYTAIESNPWYFWLELSMFIIILCLGVERLVNDLRKRRGL